MNQEILTYLVHRPPMVLIDELIEQHTDYVIARLTIRPEMMFCEEQGLPTWASIEVMAQTVSLYAGVQGQIKGEPPKLGFLLGTRKLHLPFSHFPIGCELYIKAEKQYIEDGLGVFDCEIYFPHSQNLHDVKISAKLSVYEPAKGEYPI